MKKRKNIIEKYFNLYDKYPRHYFIFGLFFVFFLVIIVKVFTYTILDHDFYKKIADKQQIWEVKVPVTRGSILSANGEGTILATSVNLNDLAIDPTSIGNKAKLVIFLRDLVFREICIWKSREDCQNNVLKFVKKVEIEDFQYNETYIKSLIQEELLKRVWRKKVTSVLLAQGLEWDIPDLINRLHLKGVYITESNIYINPEEIVDKNEVATKLSPLISFPIESIEYLVRKRKVKYVPILSRLSIDESSDLKKYIKDEKAAIKKWFIDKQDAIYRFIVLSPNPHRFYPENKIASQVLGFVDNQWKWHYGIEGYFNDILKGEVWEIVSRKDIRGRTIDPIDLDSQKSDRQWAIIQTTIDKNIQRNVEQILESGVKKYWANKWSIVVMNPKNGKILAMANYPRFNPNKPWEVYELEKVSYRKYKNPGRQLIDRWVFVEDAKNGKDFTFDGKIIKLREATRPELFNYALKKYKYKNDLWAWVYRNPIISDLYEPGSIMKAITMAIWIDSWEITRDTFYQNNWPIKIDNFKISDIAWACRWYHSFSWALNYSCNVWMVRIIQKVWKALLYNYLTDFGFGTPTEVTLDWEAVLPMKNYEKWPRAQLFTTSYGLWISVNQLQMAVAYSALANGWLILRPQIVDTIDFQNGKIIEFKKEVLRRVISKKTSDTMIDVLVDSVNRWVAKTWKVEWYSIAGKTWTSQIAYKWWYESWYLPGSTNASFAWFGPAQDPKFVVIVKLFRPRTNNYWGLTSAYIFADTTKYLLDYYKIPKLEK